MSFGFPGLSRLLMSQKKSPDVKKYARCGYTNVTCLQSAKKTKNIKLHFLKDLKKICGGYLLIPVPALPYSKGCPCWAPPSHCSIYIYISHAYKDARTAAPELLALLSLVQCGRLPEFSCVPIPPHRGSRF